MDHDVTRKRCSFCGRQGERGLQFAGGLGAMICEDCVSHYHELFSDTAAADAAAAPPWERMTDAEILGAIPSISQTAEQVDEFLVEWIELARSRKLSWTQIGKSLGVSKQAAWERFAQRVDTLKRRSTA